MEYIKELSILDIYEDINILKKTIDNLIYFDFSLTKNEYTFLNGSFSKYSLKLKPMPIIKVYQFFNLDEYINLIEQKKIRNEKKI